MIEIGQNLGNLLTAVLGGLVLSVLILAFFTSFFDKHPN